SNEARIGERDLRVRLSHFVEGDLQRIAGQDGAISREIRGSLRINFRSLPLIFDAIFAGPHVERAFDPRSRAQASRWLHAVPAQTDPGRQDAGGSDDSHVGGAWFLSPISSAWDDRDPALEPWRRARARAPPQPIDMRWLTIEAAGHFAS